TCVSFCNPEVMCPVGQKCAEPDGCVPNCQGVTCDDGQECDPQSGNCVDTGCAMACFPPTVCMNGQCVNPTGSGSGGGSGTASGGTGGKGEGGSGFGGSSDAAGQNGGCCGVAGGEAPNGHGAAALALLGLGIAAASRRRRERGEGR